MSFVWKAPQRLYSYEYAMSMMIKVAQELGIRDVRGACICAAMCYFQESDGWMPGNLADPCYAANPDAYPHDSESDDGQSTGWYQQQMNAPGTPPWGWGGVLGDPEGTRKRMDPYWSTRLFLDALNKNGFDASNADVANASVQRTQRSGVPLGYRKHFQNAINLYERVSNGAGVPVQNTPSLPPPALRPDFTELDRMTGGGRDPRSRKPINFFIHTEEGGSNAEQLARFCNGSNGVSYHYTVRDRIVCDVVDTDWASWSVLDANVFSINLCFAGSRAAMSREEWLEREDDIEIAAYLAVQDCKKYGMSTEVLIPRWALSGSEVYAGGPRGGISDHNYVTRELGIGNHTDVGPNFPWDVFKKYVDKYLNGVGEDMANVPQDQWDRVFKELTQRHPSRSIYRTPGEGQIDTMAGFTLNVDAVSHQELVDRLATQYGDSDAITRIARVAAGKGADPNDEWAIQHAKDVINKIPPELFNKWEEEQENGK